MKLENYMREQGVSQLELARRTRIAPADISRIIHGKIYPYPSWRSRIAEALGSCETDLFQPLEVKSDVDEDC